MHSSNEGRRVGCPPSRLREGIIWLRIVPEQMLDGTGELFESSRHIKEIHLVVLLSDLIRQTASPCLDLVEPVLLLIVPRFAHVHLFVLGEAARSAFVVAGNEHDEASVYNFVDSVVSILPSLDYFILEEVLLESMDSLFWTIVPARIDVLLPGLVLPSPVDLSDDGLCQVIWIGDMDPIT
jgi:hypothetical protein